MEVTVPDMEDCCEYIERAVTDGQQGWIYRWGLGERPAATYL